MSKIVKKLFAILLITATAVCLYAQPAESSAPDIDLSLTVISLAKAVETGRGIPAAGTPVIINGTVIERTLIDGEKETFAGELIIASGEWVSSAEVEVSRCAVLLNGPRFADTIPARRSRTVNPKEIETNSELIVYGVYLGYADTDDGPLAVLQAYDVRKL